MTATEPPAPPIEALAAWHDFFALAGTASVTLIGAMFVVASIGSGFLTSKRASEIRVFLTPTVIHLSAVLVAGALALVPFGDATAFGALIGLIGLAGAAYAGGIALHIGRRGIGWDDRVWYALVPLSGHALLVAAALAAVVHAAVSLDLLAAALAMLLIAALRNAWDLILFLVAQAKDAG